MKQHQTRYLVTILLLTIIIGGIINPPPIVEGQGPTVVPSLNPIVIDGFNEIHVGSTSWQAAIEIFSQKGYRISSPGYFEPNLVQYEVDVRHSPSDFGDPRLPDIRLQAKVFDDTIEYTRLYLYGTDVSLAGLIWENIDPAKYINLYGTPDRIAFDGEPLGLTQFSFGLSMIWRDQRISVFYGGVVAERDNRGDAFRICLDPSRVSEGIVSIAGDAAPLEETARDIDISNLVGINSYGELVDTLRRGECFLVSIYGYARADYTPTIYPLETDTPEATNTPTSTSTPPPTDTPTSTLTHTPTLIPTSTPTPTIPARFTPLRLRAVCSPFPALFRVWRVENDNRFALPFTWEVVGTRQDGHGVALAHFDSYFFTATVRNNPNTVRILVRGVEQDVEPSTAVRCR